ncbi:MAG: bifunctional hydroxymethylpyrimidine kinase/phosphomethylpyrimidine kinase [Clostridia bacterium]|nr:bifunctional hydroxymethylpyrimidine kinase/phosphomethylpyrimidine kinase [Clostridia bacterium]
MAKRALVVGFSEMEITLPVSDFTDTASPSEVEGEIRYAPAGRGANAAVALAKNGVETFFLSCIGHDAHGETLYDFYKESNVNLSLLRVLRGKPTGCRVVLRDGKGKTKEMIYKGANAELSASGLDKGFLYCPDAVYLSMDIGEELVLYAADYAYRHGIAVFLDGVVNEKNKAFPLERLAPITVFSPNEEETQLLTGICPLGTEACLSACVELSKRINAEYIVLKLGERGAFIYHGRHFEMIPPYSVRNRHYDGVGDAFTAALTARFIETGDMTESAKYATAAAAITLSREGGGMSIPSADEVLAYIQAQQA